MILALFPWLWKDLPDQYFPYSGVVVEKHFPYLYPGGRYIILEDAQGRRFKKYVNAYGYAYARVGAYVVKKRGLYEYPLPPGEKTPYQMLEKIERQKSQKQQPNP